MLTFQAKITNVGDQTVTLPSVVFKEASAGVDLGVFEAFHRSGLSYANDTAALVVISLSAAELVQMIDKLSTLSNVTGGGVTAASPSISFSMHNAAGGVGFEAILDWGAHADFFTQLLSAIANRQSHRELEGIACTYDAGAPGMPADVTSRVSIRFGGFRLKRARGPNVFVGVVVVMNTSSESIPGPVSIVLAPALPTEVLNEDGSTCNVRPQGRPFYAAVLASDELLPNQEVTMIIEARTDLDGLEFPVQVLSGPGGR